MRPVHLQTTLVRAPASFFRRRVRTLKPDVALILRAPSGSARVVPFVILLQSSSPTLITRIAFTRRVTNTSLLCILPCRPSVSGRFPPPLPIALGVARLHLVPEEQTSNSVNTPLSQPVSSHHVQVRPYRAKLTAYSPSSFARLVSRHHSLPGLGILQATGLREIRSQLVPVSWFRCFRRSSLALHAFTAWSDLGCTRRRNPPPRPCAASATAPLGLLVACMFQPNGGREMVEIRIEHADPPKPLPLPFLPWAARGPRNSLAGHPGDVQWTVDWQGPRCHHRCHNLVAYPPLL